MDVNIKVRKYIIGMTCCSYSVQKVSTKSPNKNIPQQWKYGDIYFQVNQHKNKYSNENQTHQVCIIHKLRVWRSPLKEFGKRSAWFCVPRIIFMLKSSRIPIHFIFEIRLFEHIISQEKHQTCSNECVTWSNGECPFMKILSCCGLERWREIERESCVL